MERAGLCGEREGGEMCGMVGARGKDEVVW